MANPAYLYAAAEDAVDAKTPPTEPKQLALYTYLTTKQSGRSDMGDAYDLFMAPDHRAALEAFILTGASPALIERVLQIPTSVTETYKAYFFDSTVFRNKLEVMEYAAQFDGSSHAREVLRAAVTVGLEYLLWVYGSPEVQVDARQVIRHTMAEAYYRGMAHRGNSLTSGVTKEAHRWWATAVKNAELLERIDPRAEKQAFEEIRIQLEKADDTYTVDTAPVDVADILH